LEGTNACSGSYLVGSTCGKGKAAEKQRGGEVMHTEVYFELTGKEVYKRVGKAFVELRKQKVMARMNYACCQSCGLYDIQMLADQYNRKNVDPCIGYVFFHRQDKHHWVHGNDMYLCYGGNDDYNAMEIGERIVTALNQQGVETHWDGDINTRIRVLNPEAYTEDGDETV
jgi:hypothetical protein